MTNLELLDLNDKSTVSFQSFYQACKVGFIKWTEVVGYSRAAAHLSQLGYHAEAKACMMELSKLQNKD